MACLSENKSNTPTIPSHWQGSDERVPRIQHTEWVGLWNVIPTAQPPATSVLTLSTKGNKPIKHPRMSLDSVELLNSANWHVVGINKLPNNILVSS